MSGVNIMGTYTLVICPSKLFCQPHQQHAGPVRHPVGIELFFGGDALDIVGRLQHAEKLGEGGVDLWGEDRHGERRKARGKGMGGVGLWVCVW